MNGEGSVYQRRSDGRWIAAVSLGYDGNGKQRRKVVSARTKAEVLQKLRRIHRQVDDGLPPSNDQMTVGQLLNRWHRDVLSHQVAPSAAANYKTIADHHVIPALGRHRVATLTSMDVDRLIAQKTDAGYAPSTVRRIRSVLVQALDQAVRWAIVPRNVAAMTRSPKAERREGRTLTPEEARKLLHAAEEHRLGALFTVMLSLGLRRGEALGLAWSDLDLAARTLSVRRALKREQGQLIVGEVKTPRSRRSLNLPDPLVPVLRRQMAAQANDRRAAGPRWAENGLVFTTRLGGPIDPRNVYRDFRKFAESIGLGRWHPHELCHSAASLMLMQSVPLEVVSNVLGHSTIRITADVYGHILEPQRQSAAEAMAGALWPKSDEEV